MRFPMEIFYCLTIVKKGGPRRYKKFSIPLGLMIVSPKLTSLTSTPTYVHNPPFSTTIPARTDLHFKFVFGDADRLESRLEYIVIRWRIPQRGNTLKVIQKALTKKHN